MRYNTALDVATERSKDLFSLPGVGSAILLNIIAITVPWSGFHVFRALETSIRYLFTSTAFFATSLATIWRSAEYFDLRRSLWSSFFILLPLSVGSLLEIISIPFYSMLYTSLLLASLISWSLSKSARGKLLPVILAVEAMVVNGPSSELMVISILPMVAAFLVGSAVGSVTEPVLGLRGFDGVRSLADIVLGGSGSSLEEVVEERGIRGRASFDLIVFGDSVLVTADVHPGPFRMGSHDFPRRLVGELRRRGWKPLFLRRACSHERNLASSRLSEELVRRIADSLDRVVPCRVGRPYFITSNEFEVSAQRFGDVMLLTVSGRPLESFEDIPHEVEELVSRELGIEVSVVDRHDSLRRERYEMAFIESDLGKRLVDILVRVGKRAMGDECDDIRVGYAWDDPLWPSVSRGGVGVLSVRSCDTTISYMMIDGNNMVPELRDLIDELSPEGVRVVVATTDTHETVSTKRRYNPVGSECEDEECLREKAAYLIGLVSRSLESAGNAKALCYRGSVEVIFMGSELMAMLSSLIRSSRMARPLMGLALLPQLLSPLLWV